MAETTMEEVINLEGELVPCEICGRTFLPAPLIKHKKVCERNATKQRKIFDSQKQRVEGTEFAPFNQSHVKKTVTGTPYAADAFKRAKWKEKHLELVKTIRAARGVGMTNKHSASSTSLSHDAPGTERCPSCDRQFGPRAYDRHVEWCKDHVTYVHRSPAQVLLAKERLEARIKYRVPAPKSKRAVVKEKYSPGLGSRTESFSSIKSTSCTYLDNTHKVQKTKPVVNLKKSNEPSVYNQGDSAEINKRTERANRKNLEDHVDPINSHQTNGLLILRQKVNIVAVNCTVGGLTVQPINRRELVTWSESVARKSRLALPNLCKKSKGEDDSLIRPFLTPQFTKLPMRVATNKLVTRVVNKSESPIQVGRPTNGSSSESDLELEENMSKVRGSLESSECADGVESLRSSEADSLEYCTKNVEWEDTDAVYFRDNSLVETAQKLWREEKCTDLDIEPKGPKSSSSSSDRSTFKEVLSAHPLDQIHSESDLSVCNISSEDSGGETLSLKLANDDTREYAHPPCESLKEKWPTFESELSNPDHSCKATTELSVDREGNTSDYIPKKRRKFNDNLTTIVPTHYDSYRLNLGESAIYSSRSEKATKRLSPRLLALINVITNAPGDNSNRSATDQLLTISIGDCRRLLELDPNAVPVGDMLSKMNLTRSSASEEAELLKTKLPLISKVPVQKVSYDKNVSSRSSIVSLPQIVPKSVTHPDYNPFLTAERQLMELLECDDFQPFISKHETIKSANRPHTVSGSKTKLNEANHNNNKIVKSAETTRKKLFKNGESKKRASVIDPPTDFQDGDDFELIESLINQNYLESYDLLDAINEDMTKTRNQDDSPTIDPRLINENDNLAIPDHLIVHHSSSNSSNDNLAPLTKISSSTRHLTRSSETLHQTANSRNKVTKTVDTNSKVTKPKKAAIVRKPSVSSSKNAPTSEVRKPAPFKKSLSVQEPPKPKSNFKDDLQVEVLKKPRKSTELPSVDFAKGDDLFDVDDVMLEEFKKFEENYLKDKDKQRRKKERELHEVSTNVDNGGGSPVSKINIDSAYNSLNRNNPKVRAKPNSLSPLEYNRPQTSPIASPTSSSSDTTSMPLESQQRVSKFCHECGTRYPIITAKFCVECGVKRLVL